MNLDDPTVSYLLEKQPDTPDPLLDFVQSHGSALTVNQNWPCPIHWFVNLVSTYDLKKEFGFDLNFY